MIIYEYVITLSPNPENPNEQEPGTEIWDDRLYGLEEKNILLTYNAQTYNRAFFTKSDLSNKLSSTQLTFNNGDLITLTAKK